MAALQRYCPLSSPPLWTARSNAFAVVPSIEAAAAEGPFDYVVVTVKALPDLFHLPDLIRPLVTDAVTSIVLIQNGLDIEVPVVQAFPSCAVMSGVSMVGSRTSGNSVYHEGPDEVVIGPHVHSGLERAVQLEKARLFVETYSAGGAACCTLSENIVQARWRKLMWNGTFNTLCTLSRMDCGALQQAGGKESLLIPAMREMREVARTAGYAFPDTLIDALANSMPIDSPFRPSMLVDVDKGNPLELEVILGAPLKYAKEWNVPTPILGMVYELLKLVQWKILKDRGSR